MTSSGWSSADNPDHDPAIPLIQHLEPADVLHVLVATGSMLITVILDCDLDVLPAHVQIRVHPTPLVANSDLGLRAGKPGIQQQEAQPGLLRRLRTAVDQLKSGLERLSSRGDHGSDRPTARCRRDFTSTACASASIAATASSSGISPGEVERGPGRCGDAHTVDEADLVVSNALLPDLHAGGWAAVGVDDRGGPRAASIQRGAVKSGGGEAGKYRRGGASAANRLWHVSAGVSSASRGYIDILMQRRRSDCAADGGIAARRGKGLAAEEGVGHGTEVVTSPLRQNRANVTATAVNPTREYSPWRYARQPEPGQISATPHEAIGWPGD